MNGNGSVYMVNPLYANSMNVITAMTAYSPLIVITILLSFSIFTGMMPAMGAYSVCLFIITFLRVLLFNLVKSLQSMNMPSVCLTGVSEIFVSQDVTYSIYLMSFTFMYLVLPLLLMSVQHKINVMNYGVLFFFLAYLLLDIVVKTSLQCVPGYFSSVVLGNVISGFSLGAIIAVIMYGTALKRYLFVNKIGANGDVCSVASKQQFKCKVYKNGQVVGQL